MSNIGESQVWNGRIFSDGWKTAAGGTQAVVEPATGESIGLIGVGSAEDIDNAVVSATKAQEAWASMPFDQRAAIMREAARLLK
jgi:benzaldehyde dehydrogenase (NAD)